MKDFTDKTVYVVGGSSGIGLAAAELFAENGAHVCIFAQNEARLKKANKAVAGRAAAKTQRFATYSVDVADNGKVERIMKQALKEFGVPELLLNAAGVVTPRVFEEVTYEQFDRSMRVNVYGTRNTIAALLPAMKKRGGAIVNISSIAGYVGVFGYTDYNATKFAVLGFSEALRSELKPFGIEVFVLCPPDTDTPGLATENLTRPPETQAIAANAKLMKPEAVAAAMIKGIRKGKFIILPGFDAKFTVFGQRFIPWVVRWVVDRAVRKVQKKR
jgi:3-dehydrosphinganine reductase